MSAPRANPAQIAPGDEAAGGPIDTPFVGSDPHPVTRGESLNAALQDGIASGRY